MIILDTNVISEIMKSSPNQSVIDWLGRQKPLLLNITTITIAEIQRGLSRLPEGSRRTKLTQNFDHFLTDAFDNGILPFDLNAAMVYGEMTNRRELKGLHIDAVDLMIASIAFLRQAKIATRNTKDFTGCGIELINPWQRQTT